MENVNFFNTGDFLHTDVDQVKRQKTSVKLNVQEIDKDAQTGKINDYSVSLSECSCRDFILRKKPCKHMYRLAHELGLFQLAGKIVNDHSMKNYAARRDTKKHLVEVVSQLCDEDKYVLYEIMYEYLYHGKIPTAMKKSAIPDILIKEQLISVVDTNIEALARASRMDGLKSIIRSNNCEIKLRKKSEILEKLSAEYPDLFQAYIADFGFVMPSPDVLISPRKIYSLVLPPDREEY